MLPGKNEQGFGSGRGTQEQAELPAWLESLRASDRPSAKGSPGFDPTQGVGEGTLPGWMRSAGGEAKDTPPPQSTLRPSSFSAPNTDEGPIPRRGIAANSLIDEQLLPGWMRPDGATAAPQKDIAAASLIQSDSVPEWMKALQQQSPTSMPAPPAQSTAPVSSLPPGFSPRDLVDPQSLPSWMAQQGASAPTRGQTFSASSLLDMDALPSWMREGDSERGTAPGAAYDNVQEQAQGSSIAPQPQQWQQQALPPSQPLGQMPPDSPVSQTAVNNLPQSSLSAASFIDRNALPEWLRSDVEPGLPSQTSPVSPPSGSVENVPQASPRPGPYAVPTRGAENLRVPTRPRGEMGAPESSEVAANVFASMLGVASAAPQFPPQGQAASGGQHPPRQGAQAGMPPTQYGAQGHMSGPFPTGGPPQQMPQGYPRGMYNSPYPDNVQPNAPMGVSPTMMPPQRQSNSMGMAPAGPGMAGEQRGNTKPVKRNLFEAIRNWLFRS